jgi:hypothetical protein
MAHRYLSDVISRQDHELAMEECATSHAFKIGEAAVVAEQEKQAHAQELAFIVSAHSAETERARKVRSATPFPLKPFQISASSHTCW